MTLARLIEAVADESATITSEMLGALPTHPEVPVRRLVLNIIHNGRDMNSALALHDALLPGWVFDITNGSALVMPQSPWDVSDDARGDDGYPQWTGESDVEARAWLLAILRAMEGRDG